MFLHRMFLLMVKKNPLPHKLWQVENSQLENANTIADLF